MTDKVNKGAFRKQLGIPAGKKLPKTLVKQITNADVGTRLTNPTNIGKVSIPVTKKLKKRAYFVASFM